MGVQPVGGGMVSPRAGRCGYRCQLTKDDYWDPFSFFQLYKNRAAARCALSGLEPASLGARAGCIAPRQACGHKYNTAPAHVALSCSMLPALPPPLCAALPPRSPGCAPLRAATPPGAGQRARSARCGSNRSSTEQRTRRAAWSTTWWTLAPRLCSVGWRWERAAARGRVLAWQHCCDCAAARSLVCCSPYQYTLSLSATQFWSKPVRLHLPGGNSPPISEAHIARAPELPI